MCGTRNRFKDDNSQIGKSRLRFKPFVYISPTFHFHLDSYQIDYNHMSQSFKIAPLNINYYYLHLELH